MHRPHIHVPRVLNFLLNIVLSDFSDIDLGMPCSIKVTAGSRPEHTS